MSGGLGAQPVQQAVELERIEAAVDSGRVRGAREAIDRWLADESESASSDDQAKARVLRARLMRDADSARSEYLRIAIDGRSSHGAEAWLRLAQLDLAAGQPERANEELERLRSDYPTASVVPASWYWSGRALESVGDLDAACVAWQSAAASARDAEYQEVLALSTDASEACGAGEMRFALQLDAFRERSAAEAVVARAEDAGFAARIVQDDGLYKVRVGRFGSVGPAREMASRLRAAGFSALITAENR